jgi:exopolyphosphatase / guanosine-5'-triphosphate,3'-diphosphate pyrophosphatase
VKIEKALEELAKFKSSLDDFKVKLFRLIATDAVRQAKNSRDFIEPVEKLFGQKLEVISGKKEARLGANAVLLEISDSLINGLIGDLGGGSLELTEIIDSEICELTSLELGHQRLADIGEDGISAVKKKIDETLMQIPWFAKNPTRLNLQETSSRVFYPLGGRWRKLALIYMKKKNYPLKLVSNFRVPASEMLSMIKKFKLPKKPKRASLLQFYSAYILRRILEIGKFKSVEFASSGLREGALMEIYHKKPSEKEKILFESVEVYAKQIGVFNENWKEDLLFYENFFLKQDQDNSAPEPLRLVLKNFLKDNKKNKLSKVLRIFSILKDISKYESDEYRGEFALGRALNLPVFTLDHEERVLLALLLYQSYTGKFKTRFTSKWFRCFEK